MRRMREDDGKIENEKAHEERGREMQGTRKEGRWVMGKREEDVQEKE